MNNFQIQAFVRQLIAEAKTKKEEPKKDKKDTKKPEPKKVKKTSGSLVEMKEDLAKLKEKLSKIDDLIADWESLKSSADKISYGGEGDIEIGADKREDIMSDCDAEISKLKKEKESIEKEIASLKESTSSEINKIKEMMGLVKKEKKGAKKIVDEKKEEFKGFEKPFVPKSKQTKSPTPAVGGGKNKEYSDSDVNYLTDPYEKVSKEKSK